MNPRTEMAAEFIERMYRKALRYHVMGDRSLAISYMITAQHHANMYNACRKKEFHIDTSKFERFEEFQHNTSVLSEPC